MLHILINTRGRDSLEDSLGLRGWMSSVAVGVSISHIELAHTQREQRVAR
jgi:hypothetical protein